MSEIQDQVKEIVVDHLGIDESKYNPLSMWFLNRFKSKSIKSIFFKYLWKSERIEFDSFDFLVG